MNVELYEIEYTCSPGGVDMWAIDVRDSLGHSTYNEFYSPSTALRWVMNKYPDKELQINVRSLEWYHAQQALENVSG